MKTVTVQVKIDYDVQFLQLVYGQLAAEPGRMLSRTVLFADVSGFSLPEVGFE
jgi:hypothetical protein